MDLELVSAASAATAGTTATAAESTATATTAAESAAAAPGATAPGGTALFFRPGFIDTNGITVNCSAIEHFNGRLCPFLRNHFHETETSGLA